MVKFSFGMQHRHGAVQVQAAGKEATVDGCKNR